ncbi:hypothetical protein JRQ81_013705 [Phrynocephalus forsythii]|uniref:Sulfatase N-terminal domain-containing protein n=1 Tax=Phrynocephalus forsythii TaxID=171643 RepID=A0A9Q0XZP5_9SAUR|nr:hypothetical protein JRQ81_013705 [Phrynocephalus forsythii]
MGNDPAAVALDYRSILTWALLLLPGFASWGAVKGSPLLCPHHGCPKPNVVMVMCDSFDGRLTFHPENETVALPFVNLMRTHGSLFLNAYTNSPICCPSRAAMWSGLFTHITESWNNFKGLEPNYTTWMDLMEKQGYYTQKYGKLDYTSGHHSLSNRVEAWTRNVNFLLQQEGRPVAKLIGNKTSMRVMQKDWETTDEAATWIRKKAKNCNTALCSLLGIKFTAPISFTFLWRKLWVVYISHISILAAKGEI